MNAVFFYFLYSILVVITNLNSKLKEDMKEAGIAA